MRNKTETELHGIASNEWEVFKSLIGDAAIKRAMVIILRKQGLSYGQIATRLKISRQWAQEIFFKYHESNVS